jgi:hypothetical protein
MEMANFPHDCLASGPCPACQPRRPPSAPRHTSAGDPSLLSSELQRHLLVAHLSDDAFQDFAFMLNRPPKIMPLAVNLHEYLVQMPLPVRA